MDAAAKALPYLLVLIAFSLRLYRIDYQSIWRDEGVSLHLAASSIPAILANRARDVHPPLYFVLLHFWTGLAGFSELSARFFSLIFGVLLIPSLYSVVSKMFGKRTALITAAIASLSPLYVVYSQEVRTYAMLPLPYLFIIYRLYQLARGEELAWRHCIALAAVEVLYLHLHYFPIFAVVYMNLFLAVLWLRRKEVNLRRWVFSQGLAALCCAPWAWMVIGSWMTEGPPKTFYTGPALRMAPFKLASFIWHFSNAGNDLRDHHLFTPLSSLLAVVFIAALSLSLKVEDRRQILITLCHWMVPLAMVLAFNWWKPVTARYVIMFTVPFFILMGRVIVVSIGAKGLAKPIGLFLTLTLVTTLALGLEIAFFDSYHFKENARGMVEYLESLTNANDVIIVHPIDYAVEYYYTGDAPIAMIEPHSAQVMASLEEALQGKGRAFLAWPWGSLIDKPSLLPFLLEMGGRFAGGESFKGYSLRIFELEREGVFPPKLEPVSADFGDVRLIGAFYQRKVEANDAICLALRWQLVRATKKAYKAVVILWDEAGRRLSGADVLFANPKWGLSTERWAPGEEAVNYYIVPIPLGTPPLSYRITVGVYDAITMKRLAFLDEAGNPAGEDFPLGEVKLTKARDFEHDPYQTEKAFRFQPIPEPEIAKGLALEGFHLDGQRFSPGEKTGIVLKWRALEGNLPDYTPCLCLKQDGIIIARSECAPADGRYPTGLWRKGEFVLDRRDLVISPQAEEGKATLEIEVNGRVRTLAQLEIAHSERIFTIPAMEHELKAQFGDFAGLIGYDLDRTEVTVKDKVKLTLYWRAINEEPVETSHKVFTHLLDEGGRLIGQHDGFPAWASKPTTSWVEGEIIMDVHEMEFREPYQGEAIIEVGMYDPTTGERLPVFDEDGKPLPNNRVLLETVITVR